MLQNKVIFLTGGADGIGWECARAYARNGALLCIADIKPLKQEQLAVLDGEGHLSVCCDLAREAEVQQAVQTAVREFGGLDAIHNNAAVTHPSKPLHTTSNEEWDLLMEVNVKSILYTTRYGLPHLRQPGGVFLMTSSLVGSIGQEHHAAYVATKGAVNALVKAMALDYAPLGIRVNAIGPAAIRTQALEAWSREQPDTTAIRDYLDQLQPLGAMPAGDVIADAAVFLLSNAARFITGCILPVSGGAELGYRSVSANHTKSFSK
ncbi:SDR family NAD(P)-dependent oxidoreductase [Niabella beijingensis]|uniref:SDR family NAD(P)-dependent oxidoreductase n=1 Tax=Niabella beijingensis TaxID=2872700 RepID=UPI001CBAD92A|nr:SDR family oxidoreductase [Niabella beijingensis]MBZ4191438.1 SDR family oxidoreductase [Niabella beijingensis]